jgi:hypothetical protein
MGRCNEFVGIKTKEENCQNEQHIKKFRVNRRLSPAKYVSFALPPVIFIFF